MILKIKQKPYILHELNTYVKSEALFLFFIFTAFLNALILRAFTVGNVIGIKPALADIAFLLLGGTIAYFIKQKSKFIFLMCFSVILSVIFFIDAMYYSYYDSFTSVSLFMTSQQLGDVQDAIFKNILHLYHFIFFWQPAAFAMYYRYIKKSDEKQRQEKAGKDNEGITGIKETCESGKNGLLTYKKSGKEAQSLKIKKRIYAGNTVLVALAFIALFASLLSNTDYSRFRSQWYREYIVMQFGVYTYHLNDIVQTTTPKIYAMTGMDQAKEYVSKYYENRENITNPDYTGVLEGKDIYVIHAESIQQFLMELSFNGEEVTPNLNRLAKEGMFFSNFYTQTSVGTSSDTEFTFNTSLMPASSGTVFINYFDRKYVTMPELLKEKGYYPFSMHANSGSFWNRKTMHMNMGYEQMIDKSSYIIDEEIGLGLSDMSFFRQSIPMIKTIKEREQKPLYATIIMLTNHTPFADTDKIPEFPVDMKVQTPQGIISMPYMEGTKMGNYIKTAHYADMAIGQFIQDMEEQGLLDNAAVVIYGDHDAKLPDSGYERLYNYDPLTGELKDPKDPDYRSEDFYTYELDKKVPFIIWTKDGSLQMEVEKTMGMLDVLPTLGNMLAVSSPYQLGQDILSPDTESLVPFPNGNFLSEHIYYDSQEGQYRRYKGERISDYYIERYGTMTDEMIKISNYIMKYDLLREEER